MFHMFNFHFKIAVGAILALSIFVGSKEASKFFSFQKTILMTDTHPHPYDIQVIIKDASIPLLYYIKVSTVIQGWLL